MKYTQHFKKMKAARGVPKLSFDRHSRYFNIVAIEFHIDQLKKMMSVFYFNRVANF